MSRTYSILDDPQVGQPTSAWPAKSTPPNGSKDSLVEGLEELHAMEGEEFWTRFTRTSGERLALAKEHLSRSDHR
jgi:hypothetical protein